MDTRNWPIRSKIVALVIVPLSALLALWIFATTLTFGPAMSLLSARTLLDEVGRPGEAVVAELQRERRLSLIFLASKDGDAQTLQEQRVRTDEAIAEFRRRASADNLSDEMLRVRLDQTFTALDVLPSGRGFIDRREMDSAGALGLYTGIIASTFRAYYTLATLPDEDLNRRVRALTAMGQSRELLGQADALLAGVFAAGKFRSGEYGQLLQIVGSHRFLQQTAVADLPESDRATYQRLAEGEAFARLNALEKALVNQGGDGDVPPFDAEAWHNSYESVQQQLRDFELSASQTLAEDSVPVAVQILIRLGAAGILGLVAIVASVVIALRIGRSIVQRLTGLRAAALEMAGERLPSVVARLRRGEDVNVAEETPPLRYGEDEIGQVGQAFNEVRRTAVQSAVEEAVLRRGLNEVFLNIARRSQALLHRQLAVLDRMERRTTEPEELEDLFRIDHMATRMRRHAEDLVILAGATPGRGWRNPVAMIDVIRGAVSEVEDYARIDIMAVQPAAVVGRAVGDVIHLLAELIENAAVYSPPHTRVLVSGQEVPNGYTIEIEDRGLGMTAEAIDEANQRLADPPDFDPNNSARLGLFVVARLGARHQVRVRLRPSPHGGVTAVVLIPAELVVLPGVDVCALPGQPGPGRWSAGAVALPAGGDPDATQNLHRSPAALAPMPSQPPAEARRRIQTASRLAAMPTQRVRPATDAARSATGPAAAPPAGTVDPPAGTAAPPAGAAAPGRAVGGTNADGLPRRVRQSSLAPQLRGTAATVRPAANRPVRSPDEVRAAMSALQRGTERGRREAGAVGSVRATASPPAGAVLSPSNGTTGAGRSGTTETDPAGGACTVAEVLDAAVAADASPLTDRGSNDCGRNG